ncbi:MAG: formate dehydrogenase subunit gamma [Rhodospirillales bacterium]|nr:formate dehydrogenase subunit gamma [Rhodospirillales bacterium]
MGALFDNPVQAQTKGAVPGNVQGTNNDSDMWRRLRRGEAFLISDPRTGTVVSIQSGGEEWRAIRNGPLSTYGGWLLAISAAAMMAMHLLMGCIKIDGGPSGRWVSRFSNAERVIHWYVAATFIILSLSGLTILFGKQVLIPVIGQKPFAVLASASLEAHNLFGPLFIVGIVSMIIIFIKDNFLKAADIKWLLMGGLFSKAHPPSWKYNFGEKAWFWIAALTGLVLSVSGIVLDFPSLLGERSDLQLALLFHAGAAMIVISVGLAHIYLGTLGVEGALEGMTAGHVDENWAIQHHDLWAEKVLAEQTASLVEKEA